MRVVVTGAGGFIGRNLVSQLRDRGHDVSAVTRASTAAEVSSALQAADAVCHMAGVNRPEHDDEFVVGNVDVSQALCDQLRALGRPVRVIFASSMHVHRDNAYGRSKRAAEMLFEEFGRDTGSPVHLFRLPHVIGKWCRPNYNSVVATFCHNISRRLPVRVDDPAYPLTLVYVDDLVATFERIITGSEQADVYPSVQPSYATTVGELVTILTQFRDSRASLMTGRVGAGMLRALYSTYLSYLPIDHFSYSLTLHEDPRGVFVEMLKTPDCGQFSFFTAHPGITRGGHYHHTKAEKFLVLKGRARFRFRNVLTEERHDVFTSGERPEVVEMIPGWVHDITNVGDDELVVMLWANEVFDPARPDTFASGL